MNGKRWWLICAALFLMSFSAAASEAYPSLTEAADSAPRRGKFIDRLYQCVKKFSQIDTTYIEQQKYNFTVMLYNSNTYERYTLKSKDGQRVTFSPDMSYRVGPYFGWRWICLGYTIDLRHVSLSSDHSTKKEFDMSFYSNQIGLDLFYRRSGNDYKVKRMTVGDGEEVEAMNRVGFDGIQVGITGFNLYYIFNHKKFSYPAAYSQSTIQRRSAGSPLVGIGYTHHSLKLDAPKLARLVHEKTLGEVALDSSFYFDKIKYSDISVSGGYAYNWVFARNWLFDASLSLALAYKHSRSESSHFFQNFSFHNFNFDGVGRFALVWNNSKWYAGTSAIFHTYNYNKSRFYISDVFGSLNFYVGFNFGKR